MAACSQSARAAIAACTARRRTAARYVSRVARNSEGENSKGNEEWPIGDDERDDEQDAKGERDRLMLGV
jgi:hypothetical protein